MRVVGPASLVPFDKSDPDNPVNRRISIIVMTKAAEESAIQQLAAPLELDEALLAAEAQIASTGVMPR